MNPLYRDISLKEEVSSCLLCNNAPCSQACPYDMKVDKIIRSLRFENRGGATALLPTEVACMNCESKACLEACTKKKVNKPVPIDEVMIKAEIGRAHV